MVSNRGIRKQHTKALTTHHIQQHIRGSVAAHSPVGPVRQYGCRHLGKLLFRGTRCRRTGNRTTEFRPQAITGVQRAQPEPVREESHRRLARIYPLGIVVGKYPRVAVIGKTVAEHDQRSVGTAGFFLGNSHACGNGHGKRKKVGGYFSQRHLCGLQATVKFRRKYRSAMTGEFWRGNYAQNGYLRNVVFTAFRGFAPGHRHRAARSTAQVSRK